MNRTPNPARIFAASPTSEHIRNAARSLPHRDWCGRLTDPCPCEEIRIGTVRLVIGALLEADGGLR